jgi:hypothetical protein
MVGLSWKRDYFVSRGNPFKFSKLTEKLGGKMFEAIIFSDGWEHSEEIEEENRLNFIFKIIKTMGKFRKEYGSGNEISYPAGFQFKPSEKN